MMSFTKETLTSRITSIIFILIAIQMAQAVSSFNDVPPPPTRPERFQSREELKRYLQLVHEYYAIIGRPRFGRSLTEKRSKPSDKTLFNFFDINGDKSITFEEFHDRIREE